MDNKNIVMKTGHDLVDDSEGDKQRIVAMVTAFTDKAVRSACIYVKHGKRCVVTLEDIKRAMMLEVFLFNKRPNMLEKAKEIKEELYGEEENEEEDEALNEVIVSEEEEMVPFTPNECTCAFCGAINSIYTRWNNWEATSAFEKLLKKHIEKME